MDRRISQALAASAALLLAGCQTPGTPDTPSVAAWRRASFSELPATQADSWERALEAFSRSCGRMGSRAAWKAACQATPAAKGSARRFFEKHFRVWKCGDTGMMTGYYEPELRASAVKTGHYSEPILAVPRDLVTVELASVYPQLKGMRLRGRLRGDRLVPYPSRAEIAAGEPVPAEVLAWIHDPVDALFLQIQGSGRLLMEDGTTRRVGYANQNGHPYRAVGRWLRENEGIPPSEMSMQKIREWAAGHPERAQEMLNYNASYVFFRSLSLPPDLGPIGAQGIPLTPAASVAADRKFWDLGTPVVIEAWQDNPAMRIAQPAVVQDTGGAIVGRIRFDYFWGSGEKAGAKAGQTKSHVRAWALLPEGATPR